ncbi:MAG: DUF4469 domain-containing protein [Prevotellaceae bacterium]|nr:DUF4469 domain-containing protein [Prevotellaceae bacterium]
MSGRNMKVVSGGEGVGIEFVSLSNAGTVYPVPTLDILVNHPSSLLVVAPAAMAPDEKVTVKVTPANGQVGCPPTGKTVSCRQTMVLSAGRRNN